jgi:hypothetical protein
MDWTGKCFMFATQKQMIQFTIKYKKQLKRRKIRDRFMLFW